MKSKKGICVLCGQKIQGRSLQAKFCLECFKKRRKEMEAERKRKSRKDDVLSHLQRQIKEDIKKKLDEYGIRIWTLEEGLRKVEDSLKK